MLAYLKVVALDDHGDIAVETLQPLLIQTLKDVVAEIWDCHLKGLGHGVSSRRKEGRKG